MRIGDIEITPLIDGELVLPGPSFYPGTTDADWLAYDYLLEPVGFEPMHLNTLGGYLVRTGDRLVVVDTGIGSNAKAPFIGGGFRSALTAAGVKRADVTDVIFSHLHFDHIGWATQNGKAFFPNATYRVDRRDWEYYQANELTELEASFCYPETDSPPARLGPVEDRLELFEGAQGLLPGINTLEASGHTPGETVLELVSNGERGLLLGDLVHAEPELIDENVGGKWDFVAHVERENALESVERFKKILVDQKLPFAGAHFPGLRWSRINRSDGGLVWEILGS
jgi:glyoxylase-like metal-dependent hydrolase (beta-lactamase superfamily II)